MIKIISFPHYTCGGLLCDILNDTWSPIDPNGGIGSVHHRMGKIGDSDAVCEDFDLAQLRNLLQTLHTDSWIGTHCWLGAVETDLYDRVINITTVTYRSRLYRWIRAYHHYFLGSDPWRGLEGMQRIDKQRETAKNYLEPFAPIYNAKTINLEFADVVDSAASFISIMPDHAQRHIERWRQINHFLYAKDLWRCEAADRLHEAEHEMGLAQRYVYD